MSSRFSGQTCLPARPRSPSARPALLGSLNLTLMPGESAEPADSGATDSPSDRALRYSLGAARRGSKTTRGTHETGKRFVAEPVAAPVAACAYASGCDSPDAVRSWLLAELGQFLRPTTHHLSGRLLHGVALRLLSLDPGQFYSSITIFRDEDLEAHRRVFCTLNG